MGPVKRSYAGESGDERSARRRDALLDAALELVAADGWRALRIDGLCRAAGLNKRYFYESFADLDALTAALMARLAEDAIAATLPHMAGTDVRPPIGAFVTHLTDDPRRARVLFGAVPAEAAAEHRAEAIRQIITVVAREGTEMHALDRDSPMVNLAAAMLVGGTSQAVLDFLDGRVATDREAFITELAALWRVIGDGVAGRA